MDKEDAVIAIEEGRPYLVFRPLGCPKLVVKVYDLDKIELGETVLEDSDGKKYFEISWG